MDKSIKKYKNVVKTPLFAKNADLSEDERIARNALAKEKYAEKKSAILARRKELYHNKHKEYKKQYYAENREDILSKQLKRYHASPVPKRNSSYYSHKARYNEVSRRRNNAYYAKDTNFKVKTALRDLINKLIKHGYKNRNLEYLLGCSCDNFLAYLESKFKPGMSWNNRSEWHIGHIIPVKSFDLSKLGDIKKCYYYGNLQVLWKRENLRKSGAYDE